MIIRVARGRTLTARSWQTEAPLRMLHNNLDPDVAERPADLVVYGGTGKVARDWPSLHAISRVLATLGEDETLLLASGRPVGCCAPTNGRSGCSSPMPTWCRSGSTGRSSAGWRPPG